MEKFGHDDPLSPITQRVLTRDSRDIRDKKLNGADTSSKNPVEPFSSESSFREQAYGKQRNFSPLRT